MGVRAIGIAVVLLSLPALLLAWEREGLLTNARHHTSRWYHAILSNNANVDSVLLWMRLDSSAYTEPPSIEVYNAREWIRKHYLFSDATGKVNSQKYFPPRAAKTAAVVRTQANATWHCLGPFTWDKDAKKATGSEGIGVVRSIAVNPNAPTTLLAGTISAGVWRSADAGLTWTPVTDGIMAQEVHKVAFSATEPSVAYAALDVGLARSVDGGATWQLTSLDSRASYPALSHVECMAVSSANPHVVLVAVNNRLQLSTDAGATWQVIPGSDGTYWDLEANPAKGEEFYAIRKDGNVSTFWIVDEKGLSTGTGLPKPGQLDVTPRALIATSAAAPNSVWVLFAGKKDSVGGIWGLYKSDDQGRTFGRRCCGPDEPSMPTPLQPNLIDYNPMGLGLAQVTWDMAFAVSSTDTSFIVAGGIFAYVSSNGGQTWKATAPIHYDVQDAVIVGDTLWVSTDGGIQRSNDRGTTLEDRSAGICAVEVWGFGQAPGTGVMAIGAYHLPIFVRDDAVYDSRGFSAGWYPWSGADAMMADVHPDNTQWLYAKPWTSVRGYRHRSRFKTPIVRNLGIELGYLPFSNVAFHPVKSYTIVAIDHNIPGVVRTTDNAETWTTLKKFSISGVHVRIAGSRPATMAAIGDGKLWHSADDGATWSDITPSALQTLEKRIVDVAFDNEHPDTMWIVFGGGQQDVKVMRTTDAGTSWRDISKGLYNLPVYCINVQAATGTAFAGTANGVYSMSPQDAAAGQWQPYGSSLPTCHVHYVHPDEIDGMLRIGTTRGIWEAALPKPDTVIARFGYDTDTVRCQYVPVRFNDRSPVPSTVDSWRRWHFEGGDPAESSERSPQVFYNTPGTYQVTLEVGNSAGTDTCLVRRAVVVLGGECDVVDSKPGSCVDLTSAGDFIDLGSFNEAVNEFTFTAWVKPVGFQAIHSAILCSDVVGDVRGELGVQFVTDSNELGILWKDTDWSWKSGLRLIPDQWNHVAFSISPTRARLMVNGVMAEQPGVYKEQHLGSLQLMLGTYRYWADRNFNGYIDEVRLYRTSLSRNEILLHMHHPADPDDPRLLAWYQCNETGGVSLYDVAQSRHAILSGGARRVNSAIPYGSGVSSLVQAPLSDVQAYRITALGVQAAATRTDTTILLSRINRPAPAFPEPSVLVDARYFIVRTVSVASDFLDMVQFDVSDVEPGGNKRAPVFTVWQRPAYSEQLWQKAQGLSSYDSTLKRQTLKFNTMITANVELCLSLDNAPVSVQETRSTLQVFPNPATGHLKIVNSIPGDRITVLDSFGRILWQQTVVESHTIIPTAHLASGCYYVFSGSHGIPFQVIH